MKKLALLLFSVAFTLSLCAQQKQGKESTIVGEVVDIQCYVSGATGPGKGPKHKDCAIACAKGGIPLGILEDNSNTLFVAGQSKDAMKGANDLLLPFVAEKVRVTGKVYEKGGIRLLMIRKISKLSE